MRDDSEINVAKVEADLNRVRLEEAIDSMKDSVKLSAQLAEITATRAIKTRRDQALKAIQFLERNRPLAMLAVYTGGFVLGVLLSETARSRPALAKNNGAPEGPLGRLREA